jgi:SNF family Na+-dependent transporter
MLDLFYSVVSLSGAFVLPFLVMVVLVGMPLLLLELGLGQKLRLGAAAAWPKVKSLFGLEIFIFQVDISFSQLCGLLE